MEYELITLDNGIRFAYKQSANTQIAHTGIFIDAGSRDERSHEVGIAHLLEHMLFKGTTRRNSRQVLNRLEVVGGDLNAFTSKDKTVVHASVVKQHFERALELIADVTFNSSFPQKELAKEKKVIFEEIDMYFDTPEERIFDEFQEHLYLSHPLGNNILGTKDTIGHLTSEDIKSFVKHAYFANRIIVVAVAPIKVDKAIRICRKYFEPITLPKGDINRTIPLVQPAFNIEKRNPFTQSHSLMGGHAYPLNHPMRPALMLLSNMLGGPGMNSLLNLELREKRAYTYGVDCGYMSLTDSGFFTIFLSTDEKNIRKSKKVIHNLLYSLASSKIKESQLKMYKTQFHGQMVMAEESYSSLMFVIGRSLLDLGHVDSLQSILDKINQITTNDIRKVAEDLFKTENLSYLTYLPE